MTQKVRVGYMSLSNESAKLSKGTQIRFSPWMDAKIAEIAASERRKKAETIRLLIEDGIRFREKNSISR